MSAAIDGTRIASFLRMGIDAFTDDMDARVLFRAATVNAILIPEPGTGALLGLALLGLALAVRRRRS